MKIALMNIYSEPFGDRRTSGLITSAIYLSQYGYTPVAFGKKKKSHMDGWTYVQSFNELNDYDFIIFSAAGAFFDKKDPWWREELPKVKTPFAVQAHSELDESRMIYKEEFFSHPMCRLFLPIANGIWKDMPNIPTHAYPAHQAHIDMGQTWAKEPIVASTSRLTSTKRIKELVSKAKELRSLGYATKVWGSESSYFYTRDLLKINQGDWLYNGLFIHDDLDDILGHVHYHWNCRSYRVRFKFAPRLEIATIEALQRGCIPIVEKGSTPEIYWPHLITVNTKGNLNEMIEKISAGYGDANKCVDIFNKIHANKEIELLKVLEKFA
jgi:hypothetical protein